MATGRGEDLYSPEYKIWHNMEELEMTDNDCNLKPTIVMGYCRNFTTDVVNLVDDQEEVMCNFCKKIFDVTLSERLLARHLRNCIARNTEQDYPDHTVYIDEFNIVFLQPKKSFTVGDLKEKLTGEAHLQISERYNAILKESNREKAFNRGMHQMMFEQHIARYRMRRPQPCARMRVIPPFKSQKYKK